MKNVNLLAVVCLLFGSGMLAAQEPEGPVAPPGEFRQVPTVGGLEELHAPVPQPEPSNPPPPVMQMDYGPARPTVFMANLDYVLWFFPTRRNPTPLLSPEIGNPTGSFTSIGDENLERQLTSGGRLTVGYWLLEPNIWTPGGYLPDLGAELSFMFVGQRSVSVRDQTSPVIFRPFFDFNNHVPAGVPVAAPGFAVGSLGDEGSLSLWGSELNIRKNLFRNFPGTTIALDALVGARFLSLNNQIEISRTSLYNNDLSAFPTYKALEGNRIQESESFTTHNNFFGAQVGVNAKFFINPLVVDAYAKIALGVNHEELNIEGYQIRTLANGTQTVSRGALLALPSNIGRFERNRLAQVPEVGIKFAYPVLQHLTLSTGFTALYWNRIARAGDQIDRVIDISQIPNYPPGTTATPTGQPHPEANLRQTDLWLLGLTFGVEVKW